nr:WbqC family protein [Fusobacteriaceae bacterium]
MGKKIAILQSNYIPWKGYFDLINMVDEFILYDDMQYTRRDWRNRNKIKTPQGLQWLTIPVEIKGKFFQKIKDTRITDKKWNIKHWRTISQNYSKAKYFKDYKDIFEELYLACDEEY